MEDVYIHNSSHKEFIRNKWVEFAKEFFDENEEFGIITFPAEEMQELHLFMKEGFFEWDYFEETKSYEIKKGKIICFEKSTRIYKLLQAKLINATVEPKEIGAFLTENYHKIHEGKNTKYFPVHVVNLDYDGNLSKNKVDISRVIQLTIEFQNIFKRSFSLFITWPCTENEDEEEYKNKLREIIQGNLETFEVFKVKFQQLHKSVQQLDYDNLSIIGLSKIIIHYAAENLFTLNKNQFYVYGENNRRKMYSLLFNLKYDGKKGREHLLYQSNVLKALDGHEKVSTL